ncbi:MAG: UvrD-helicase domain-containing protein [Solirubrobacteraceae bacterium]
MRPLSAPAPMLTGEQEEAVARRRGSLLLAAGAGSGKTTVLVERYLRACVDDGLSPSQILAITFTERAAWELRERIRERMVELGRRDLARDVEGASIGTFHGFCASVLRAEALEAGLSPGFDVLEEDLAQRLRVDAFAGALRAAIAVEARFVELAAAYTVDRLRRMVLRVHAELRSAGQRKPYLPVPAGAESEPEAAATLTLIGDLLERFDAGYERAKRARSALDFDDLELRALELLQERSQLRERWAERLRLLMVDELQDTNRRQLALLAALERENLFTVGDEWQSIYGFRGADVTIFRERESALADAGASLALRRNFRSVAPLIETVNAVFWERFGDGYRPLQAARGGHAETNAGAAAGAAAGRLTSAPGRMPVVELLIADRQGYGLDEALAARLADGLPDAPLWRLAEARLLARRVAEIVREGFAPGQIAVLLRATNDVPVYERALAAERLPTLATTGSFWDGLEVGDLLAYLRVLANPLDELALHGALASLGGLSLDALALLARAARSGERPVSLWEAILRGELPELDDGDAARLSAFREGVLAARARSAVTSISELLRRAIARSSYEQRLEASAASVAESRQRLANVRKLVRLAADFERSEGRDLRAFLDHVEHLREGGGSAEPEAPAGDDDLDAVRLMSIHAAKGLEFPVVCVADLGRAPNRSEVPDLIVQGERAGLRLIDLVDPTPRATLSFEELFAERQAAAAEEEDRVLYVAMTRARDRLLLSGAASFARWPEPSPGCPPIAWLGPALAPDLPEWLAEALARDGELRASEAASLRLETARGVRCTLGTRASLALELAGEESSGGGELSEAAEPSEATDEPSEGAGELGAPAGPFAGDRRPSQPQGDVVLAEANATIASLGAEAARPRPLEGGALSYTALAELERCAYRHYLERVLQLPEAAPGGRSAAGGRRAGARARSLGELAHRLLEGVDFARGEPPSCERIAAVARIDAELELSDSEVNRLSELLTGVFAAPLSRRIARARRVRRESPFAFSLGAGEPTVTGAFDVIATEDDGRRLIVDYKSGAVTADEDLALLVARRYGAQQLIYALAALRDDAREAEVVHWFLARPDDPVHVRFDAADAARLEHELRERIGSARARGFAVSERPHRALCLTCPGRSTRLCSWSEEQMLRELDEPLAPSSADGSL